MFCIESHSYWCSCTTARSYCGQAIIVGRTIRGAKKTRRNKLKLSKIEISLRAPPNLGSIEISECAPDYLA